MGHRIISVDTALPFTRSQSRYLRGIFSRTRYMLDWKRVNRRMIKVVSKNTFDLVWVDKGLTVRPQTLQIIKTTQARIRLVSYSPDDMMNPHNQSGQYLESLSLYDWHVTTKSYNVKELKQIGAQQVLFLDNAFDPETHFPVMLTDKEKNHYGCDIGFIGGYEEDRVELMEHLARHGFEVVFRCSNWKSKKDAVKGLKVISGYFGKSEYSKIISATRINLCFLRKINRDFQTTRSIEIPACGAFMLGERTHEHLRLFVEGKEAEFFSDHEELLFKVKYYLEHEDKRRQIAHNGRKRCLMSGYSNRDNLTFALQTIL